MVSKDHSFCFAPLLSKISLLRPVSFLSGYFLPYCIPFLIFPLCTELIYRPESSPGLGRKIARRQINDPLGIAQENASAGGDCGPAEAGKDCIHLLCATVLSVNTHPGPTPGAWAARSDWG